MSKKRNLKVKALKQRGATNQSEAASLAHNLFPKAGKRTQRKVHRLVQAFPER